jgi:KDO2-lipid IV(A) lauroyltransferase
MAKRRSPILDWLVYAAVRAVVAVGQALPMGLCYRIADALGTIAHRIDRRHREVAHDNLRHAFGPSLDDAARDRLVRAVYRHFFRMIFEMLHIPRTMHLTTWRDRIRLTGHERVLDRMLDGGPRILVTGHFGNWEMAGYLFGLFGFPAATIYRPLDNPHLDRFLKTFRGRSGQKLIPKKGGSEETARVLESGGLISALADQDAGQKGLFVDFFGRPASTFKAIALMAIQYDAPIVIGGAIRTGPGFRYEVACEAILEPADWAHQPDPVRWITQEYTAALERLVRRAPEQYLWLHRRWKHQPKPRARREPGSIAAPAPHAPTPHDAALEQA